MLQLIKLQKRQTKLNNIEKRLFPRERRFFDGYGFLNNNFVKFLSLKLEDLSIKLEIYRSNSVHKQVNFLEKSFKTLHVSH